MAADRKDLTPAPILSLAIVAPMPTTPSPVATHLQRLEMFLEALRRQTHILKEYPAMLLQQVANDVSAGPLAGAARLRLQVQKRVWIERRRSSEPGSPSDAAVELRGHDGRVTAVAMLPGAAISDGLVASGDERGDIRVWTVATGRERHRFAAHANGVRCMTVISGADRLVSGGRDSTVRVWDTGDWTPCGTLAIDWRTVALSRFHTGPRVAVADGSSVLRLFDVTSGAVRSVATEKWMAIGAVAVAPDDRMVAIGCGDGLVFVIDVVSGKPVRRLTGLDAPVTSVEWSPDAQWIAAGSSSGQLVAWAAAGGEARPLGQHRNAVTALAWAPDAALLYSASLDETIRIWSMTTGVGVGSVRAHGEHVYAISLSDDGRLLASAGADRRVMLWNARRMSRTDNAETLAHDDIVSAAHVTADGQRLVTASWDHTLIEWDVQTCTARRQLRGHRDKVLALAVSPDGTSAYSGARDGTVNVWDLSRGSLAETRSFRQYDGWVTTIAITPDLLIAGTEHGRLGSWQRARLRPRWERSTGMEGVRAIAVAPTGDRLALGGFGEPQLAPGGVAVRPGLVTVHTLSTGSETPIRSDHVDAVSAIVFGPDGGSFISVGWDGCVMRHDGSHGAATGRWALGRGPLYVAALSPDGRWLLVGGMDKGLRLLVAATGEERARIFCRGEVRACCMWVTDGALMAAAGDSTGAVHFLRVHGLEVDAIAPAVSAETVRGVARRAWWSFRRGS